MILARTVLELREILRRFRCESRYEKSIGFVPTMGYLHAGHTSLMDAARQETDFLIVSIFVNPTQFGPGEDYETYPRDEVRDLALCRDHGVDCVFLPPVDEMVAAVPLVSVSVNRLTGSLCGRHRPGHFDGVTTIVTKLFNLVQPDRAYFGQKDAQQLLVIQRMVQELAFPVSIRPCPTVREPDGLAMSSRNVRLTAAGRAAAPRIYQGLQKAAQLAADGERKTSVLIDAARSVMETEPAIRIQYLECRDRFFLDQLDRMDRPALLAVAATVDGVRLIDNIFLDPPEIHGGSA